MSQAISFQTQGVGDWGEIPACDICGQPSRSTIFVRTTVFTGYADVCKSCRQAIQNSNGQVKSTMVPSSER